MPEIKHRQDNPSPEIEYSEIHIPDDRYLGTGSFKIITKPNAFSVGKAVMSIVINAPVFRISVNFNPAIGKIPMLLGLANGSEPISKKVFLFTERVTIADAHEFKVIFEDWEIRTLRMDGIQLSQEIEGLLPPGTSIPEHEGTIVLTFPKHDLPPEVQESVLNDIFDLSKYFTFYQTVQGNTQAHIYRNTEFQFVFRHYNPTFGEREIRIDFADAERKGAKAFYLAASWSAAKNSFYVGLIHSNPKFVPLREAFKWSQDKLKLIKENVETLEEMLKEA